jgi:hypothetical protein
VGQIRRRLCLTAKTGHKGVIGSKIGVECFDRDGAIEECVLCFENISHPTTGEMTDNAIPIGEYAILHASEGSQRPY